MNVVLLLLCLVGLSAYGATHKDCCKKVCVLEESVCATMGCAAQIKAIVAGIKSLGLKPMDPLRIDNIDGPSGTNYKLKNIELKGLKKCKVTNLILNGTTEYFKMYMTCPRLMSTLSYGVSNTTSCQYTKVAVNVEDYRILNTGNYGVFVKNEDQQPHFFIKSVLPRVYLKYKEKLTIYRVSDTKKSKVQQGDDIPKKTGEYLISLIIKQAMRILFVGINTHMEAHLLGEVLPGVNMPKHKQNKPCKKN